MENLVILILAIFMIFIEQFFLKVSQKLENWEITEAEKVKVLRNGVSADIRAEELVIGDTLELKPGDMIPVDCLLLTQKITIMADESPMTGESERLEKMSHAGCKKTIEKFRQEKGPDAFNALTNHEFPSPVLLSGTFVE